MPTNWRKIDKPVGARIRLPSEREIRQLLTQFVAEGQLRFTRYPARTGPRTRRSYRRTSKLRRSWNRSVTRRQDSLVAKLASNPFVAPYAVKVQGPIQGRTTRLTQVPSMRRRGWQPVPDEMERLWETRFRRRFAQRLRGET